jgi:hypothetical protein
MPETPSAHTHQPLPPGGALAVAGVSLLALTFPRMPSVLGHGSQATWQYPGCGDGYGTSLSAPTLHAWARAQLGALLLSPLWVSLPDPTPVLFPNSFSFLRHQSLTRGKVILYWRC